MPEAMKTQPEEAAGDVSPAGDEQVGSPPSEDLKWTPKQTDGEAQISEYYEAESWQFSGCGD
jgi:hypothetical protein